MHRRNLVIVVLLVAFAGLGATLWLRPRHAAPAPKALFSTAPAALTAVRAKWASGKRLVLVHGVHEWYLQAPIRAPAQPTRIGAFLAALAEPVSRHYRARRVPLAAAGLSPPRLTLVAGGQTAAFGRVNPTTGMRYVLRSGDVYMVADTILPRLAAGPWQFVDPRLLPRRAQPTQITLPSGRTSTDAGLLAAWHRSRAARVGPPRTAAKPVAAHVTIRIAGRENPITFSVRTRHPKLRLDRRGTGVEYILPAAAASRLLPAGDAPVARTTGS